ncbi:putative transport protein Sec24 [Besnoitia besnoiti]|uniref:Putative transport protein Sec24 n=1 Tax=Besnoitia besnoiti TaxID=94643 RepID=A0A2A9M4Q6_BESBE|nr:putative transport protein Sec24 [Besnoitia besnoiti]PFH31291.1 putative transport protein Sec24 [Besnoitia besnoiti]
MYPPQQTPPHPGGAPGGYPGVPPAGHEAAQPGVQQPYYGGYAAPPQAPPAHLSLQDPQAGSYAGAYPPAGPAGGGAPGYSNGVPAYPAPEPAKLPALYPPPSSPFPAAGAAPGGPAPPRTPYYPKAGAPGAGAAYPPYGAPAGPQGAVGGGVGDGSASGASAAQLLQEIQQFNSPRHFTRASVARVPHSSSLQQKLHLPVGMLIRPLAPIPPGFPTLASVNFGSCGVVVRCKRCRTYINPFVHWEAHGRRWVCNLCGFVNDTPQFYMRGLDEHGKREDRLERPELSMGSVEFVAPADYMIRPPQPPAYLFLIDVSAAAVASGLVESACAGIRAALTSGRLPGCSGGGAAAAAAGPTAGPCGGKRRPQVLVMPEIDDVFLPLSDDLFVNFAENRDAVLDTLDTIPNLWRTNACIDNCMGSALKAALLVMKHVGGKIMLFTSHPPTVGELVTKRSGGLAGAGASGGRQQQQQPDREVELLKPASDIYQQFAQQLTQSQVSVDLFVAPSSCATPSVPASAPPNGAYGSASKAGGASGGGVVSCPYYDLATVLPLAQLTGGEVRYYPAFHKLQQGEQLERDVVHVITRTTGWEAVMRIRVSRGWRISSRHGRFFLRGTDLFVLPTVNEDSTFSISMELDDQAGGATGPAGVGSDVIAVQAALLYTNSDGERRIRVHTFCLPVSQNIQDIVSSIDPEVVSCILVQQAIDQSLRSKIADGRAFLQTSCAQLLSVLHSVGSSPQVAASGLYSLPSLQHYGAAVTAAGNPSSGALMEAGRLVALLLLGALKSTSFRPVKEVTTDQRVYSWGRLLSLPVDMICAYLHPRMLPLHNLEAMGGNPEQVLDGKEDIILPPQLRLTAEEMTQDGAYLLENGEEMLLWIGRSISPHWLSTVFGVQSLDCVHPDMAAASIGDTQEMLGLRARAVVESLRRDRSSNSMRLLVVRQGDPYEQKFFAQLMEDRVPSLLLTFAEFLQKVDMRTQLQAPAPPMIPSAGAPVQQQRMY